MFWSHQKKVETQNLNSSVDTDLNSAQRETVAAPAPAGKSVVFDETSTEPPERPGLFSRLFNRAKPEQTFKIEAKWARGTVKAVFVPLAKYSHPAWLLSDEEAEAVRPEMQTFLQAIFDKYVPSFLNAWAAKHSEFANLFLAMSGLVVLKYQQVQHSIQQEEALHKVVEMPHASPATEEPPIKATRPLPQLCSLCRQEFESAELYNDHLPCKMAN